MVDTTGLSSGPPRVDAAASDLDAYEEQRRAAAADGDGKRRTARPAYCTRAWCCAYGYGGRCVLNTLWCSALLVTLYYCLAAAILAARLAATTGGLRFPSRGVGLALTQFDVLPPPPGGAGATDDDAPRVLSATLLTRNALFTGLGVTGLSLGLRALGAVSRSGGSPAQSAYEHAGIAGETNASAARAGWDGTFDSDPEAALAGGATSELLLWPSVAYSHYAGPLAGAPLSVSSLNTPADRATEGYVGVTSTSRSGLPGRVELALHPRGLRAWAQAGLAVLGGMADASDVTVNASTLADVELAAGATVWPTLLLPLGARLRLRATVALTPTLVGIAAATNSAGGSSDPNAPRFSFSAALADAGVLFGWAASWPAQYRALAEKLGVATLALRLPIDLTGDWLLWADSVAEAAAAAGAGKGTSGRVAPDGSCDCPAAALGADGVLDPASLLPNAAARFGMSWALARVDMSQLLHADGAAGGMLWCRTVSDVLSVNDAALLRDLGSFVLPSVAPAPSGSRTASNSPSTTRTRSRAAAAAMAPGRRLRVADDSDLGGGGGSGPGAADDSAHQHRPHRRRLQPGLGGGGAVAGGGINGAELRRRILGRPAYLLSDVCDGPVVFRARVTTNGSGTAAAGAAAVAQPREWDAIRAGIPGTVPLTLRLHADATLRGVWAGGAPDGGDDDDAGIADVTLAMDRAVRAMGMRASVTPLQLPRLRAALQGLLLGQLGNASATAAGGAPHGSGSGGVSSRAGRWRCPPETMRVRLSAPPPPTAAAVAAATAAAAVGGGFTTAAASLPPHPLAPLFAGLYVCIQPPWIDALAGAATGVAAELELLPPSSSPAPVPTSSSTPPPSPLPPPSPSPPSPLRVEGTQASQEGWRVALGVNFTLATSVTRPSDVARIARVRALQAGLNASEAAALAAALTAQAAPSCESAAPGGGDGSVVGGAAGPSECWLAAPVSDSAPLKAHRRDPPWLWLRVSQQGVEGAGTASGAAGGTEAGRAARLSTRAASLTDAVDSIATVTPGSSLATAGSRTAPADGTAAAASGVQRRRLAPAAVDADAAAPPPAARRAQSLGQRTAPRTVTVVDDATGGLLSTLINFIAGQADLEGWEDAVFETVPYPSHAQWVAAAAAAVPAMAGNTLQSRVFNDPCLTVFSHEPAVVAQGVGAAAGAGDADVASHSTFSLAATAVLTAATYRTLLLRSVGDLQPVLLPTLVFRQPSALRATQPVATARGNGSSGGGRVDVELPIAAVVRACGWAVEPEHIVGSGNPRPPPPSVPARAGANSAGGVGPAIGGANVHLAAGDRYTVRVRLVVSVTHPAAFWGAGGGRDAGGCPRNATSGANAASNSSSGGTDDGERLRGWTDLFLNGASVPHGVAPLATASTMQSMTSGGGTARDASSPSLPPPRVYDDGQTLAALRGRTPVEPRNPSQSEPVFGTMTGVLAGGHWHTSLMAYEDVLQQLRAQCVRAHSGCEAACDVPRAAPATGASAGASSAPPSFPAEPEPLLYRLISGLSVDVTVPPLGSLATPESDAAVPAGSLGLSASPLVALLRALDVEDALPLSQPTGVGATAAAAAASVAAVAGGNASSPAARVALLLASAPLQATPARGFLSGVAEALTNTRAYGSVVAGSSGIPRGLFMEDEGFFYPAVRGPSLEGGGVGDASSSDDVTRGWTAASLLPFAPPPAAAISRNASAGAANATVTVAPLPLWANASTVGRTLAAACRAVAAQAAACLPLPVSTAAGGGAAAAYTGSVAFRCAYPVSPVQCDVTGATVDILAGLPPPPLGAWTADAGSSPTGAGAGVGGLLPPSVAAYLAAVRAAVSTVLGSANLSLAGLTACAAAVAGACEEFPSAQTTGYPTWANVTAVPPAPPSSLSAGALGVPPLALLAAVLEGRAPPAPPSAGDAAAVAASPSASRLWRQDTPPVLYLTRSLSIPVFLMNVPRSDLGDCELSLQALPGDGGGDDVDAAPTPALSTLAAAREAFAVVLQQQLVDSGSPAPAANSSGGGGDPRRPSVWQLRAAARAAALAIRAAPASNSLGGHAAKGRLVWVRTGSGLGFTDVELAASISFLPRGGDIGSRPAYPPHRIGYGAGGDAVVIPRTSVPARGALLASLLCHASLVLAGVSRHRSAHVRVPLRLHAAAPATAAQLLLPGSEVAAEALLAAAAAAGASSDEEEEGAAASSEPVTRWLAVGPVRVSSSVDPPVWQAVQWSALARPHVFQPLLAGAALPDVVVANSSSGSGSGSNSSSTAGAGANPWALVAAFARTSSPSSSSSSPSSAVGAVSGNASLGLLLVNSLPTPVTVTSLRGLALGALATVIRTWVTTTTSTTGASGGGGGTVTVTNTTTCKSSGVRRLALSLTAAASAFVAASHASHGRATRVLTPLSGVSLGATPASRLWSGVRGLGPRSVDRRVPSLQRRRFVPAPLRSLRSTDTVPASLLLQPDGSVSRLLGYAPLAAVAGAADMHPEDLLEGLRGGWIVHLVLPASVQLEPLPQAVDAGAGADDPTRVVACTLTTAVAVTPSSGGATSTTTTTLAVNASAELDELRLPFTRVDDRALAGAGVSALATEAELSPSTDRARVRGVSPSAPVPGGAALSYAVELLPAVRDDAAGVPPALLHALPGASLQVRVQGLPAVWLRLAPQPHVVAGSGQNDDGEAAVAAAERAAIEREGVLTLSPLTLQARGDGGESGDGDARRRRRRRLADAVAPSTPGDGENSTAGDGRDGDNGTSLPAPLVRVASPAAAAVPADPASPRPVSSSPAGVPPSPPSPPVHSRRLPVVEASPGAEVGSACACAASPRAAPTTRRASGGAAAAPTVPPVTVDISTLSYELHPASLVFLVGLVLLDVLLCGWCVGDRACWAPRHRKLAALAAASRGRRGCCGVCGCGPCCAQLSLLCCGEPDACSCCCSGAWCGGRSGHRGGRGVGDDGDSALVMLSEGGGSVALAPLSLGGAHGAAAPSLLPAQEGAATSTTEPSPAKHSTPSGGAVQARETAVEAVTLAGPAVEESGRGGGAGHGTVAVDVHAQPHAGLSTAANDNPFDEFHAGSGGGFELAPVSASAFDASELGGGPAGDPFHDMLFSPSPHDSAGGGHTSPLSPPPVGQQPSSPLPNAGPSSAAGLLAAAPSPFDHFEHPSAAAPSPFDDFDAGFDSFSPTRAASSDGVSAPPAAAPHSLADEFARFDMGLDAGGGGGGAGGAGGDVDQPLAPDGASAIDTSAAALQSTSSDMPPLLTPPAAASTIVDGAAVALTTAADTLPPSPLAPHRAARAGGAADVSSGDLGDPFESFGDTPAGAVAGEPPLSSGGDSAPSSTADWGVDDGADAFPALAVAAGGDVLGGAAASEAASGAPFSPFEPAHDEDTAAPAGAWPFEAGGEDATFAAPPAPLVPAAAMAHGDVDPADLALDWGSTSTWS